MSEVIRSCFDDLMEAHNHYMWAIMDHMSGDNEHGRHTWEHMVALAAAIRKIIRALDRKLTREQARIDRTIQEIDRLMALQEEAGDDLPRGNMQKRTRNKIIIPELIKDIHPEHPLLYLQ